MLLCKQESFKTTVHVSKGNKVHALTANSTEYDCIQSLSTHEEYWKSALITAWSGPSAWSSGLITDQDSLLKVVGSSHIRTLRLTLCLKLWAHHRQCRTLSWSTMCEYVYVYENTLISQFPTVMIIMRRRKWESGRGGKSREQMKREHSTDRGGENVEWWERRKGREEKIWVAIPTEETGEKYGIVMKTEKIWWFFFNDC